MAHAKLSPSAASRWLSCTASLKMEEKYKRDETNVYAQEGTEAHELLERAIKAKIRPSLLEPEHPACQDVDMAYDLVDAGLTKPTSDQLIFSELKVQLTELCWGTLDIARYNKKTKVLEIIDYKHGRGVVVNVPCAQLDIYALAALKSLEFFLPAMPEQIYTTIVQPRAQHPEGPIRYVARDMDDLLQVERRVLEVENAVIRGEELPFSPTASNCRFCDASGNCQAEADAALKTAQSYFTPAGDVAPPPSEESLSLDQKIAVMKGRELLRNFLNSVESDIQKSLLAGEKVPGFKVVAGRSIRKWAKPEEETMEYLIKECKLKKADIAPPKLLGPAPIEKLIDPKARNGAKKLEKLQAAITKPEGKPTVVEESDPRPGIGPAFEKIEGPDGDDDNSSESLLG